VSFFFTKSTIEYLKRYEPIGTRDLETKALMEQNGIKSYFSSCLTLTLGMKYKSAHKTDNIYFVDPEYEKYNGCVGIGMKIRYIINSICYGVFSFKQIRRISKKMFESIDPQGNKRIQDRVRNFIKASTFYQTYSTLFEKETLLNADFIQHDVPQSLFKSEDEKMDYAKNLLHKYASAKYVVTSRIHAALPCLGVETPVLFVTTDELENGDFRVNGRFGGNLEMLNVLRIDGRKVDIMTPALKERIGNSKIGQRTKFENPKVYTKFRDELISTVKRFVSNNQ